MKTLGFILKNSNVCLNWTLSFSVSLQVDIVPSQGEISVGESKFFLCQGKCPRPHCISGHAPSGALASGLCAALSTLHPAFLVLLCCRVSSVTGEPGKLSGPLSSSLKMLPQHNEMSHLDFCVAVEEL